MCDYCVAQMANIPTEVVEGLDEFRQEIEALAAKFGTKLGGEFTDIVFQDGITPTPEEQAQLDRHLRFTGLMAAVGYIAGRQDHRGDFCENYIKTGRDGVMIGYYADGADIQKAKFN